MKVTFHEPDPNVFTDSPFGAHIIAVQEKIEFADQQVKDAAVEARDIRDAALEHVHRSIQHRWDFGKTLLDKRKRGSKQLPNGLLDQVLSECKARGLQVGRREIAYRVQFAERYTRDEVCRALHTWKSWSAVKRSLPRPESPRPVTHIESKAAETNLKALLRDALNLTEADLRALDRIQELIADIHDRRANTTQTRKAK